MILHRNVRLQRPAKRVGSRAMFRPQRVPNPLWCEGGSCHSATIAHRLTPDYTLEGMRKLKRSAHLRY